MTHPRLKQCHLAVLDHDLDHEIAGKRLNFTSNFRSSEISVVREECSTPAPRRHSQSFDRTQVTFHPAPHNMICNAVQRLQHSSHGCSQRAVHGSCTRTLRITQNIRTQVRGHETRRMSAVGSSTTWHCKFVLTSVMSWETDFNHELDELSGNEHSSVCSQAYVEAATELAVTQQAAAYGERCDVICTQIIYPHKGSATLV